MLTTPDFLKEESLMNKGYKIIAGIDEAGRGPLAGPVVAAAVVFKNDRKIIRELIEAGVRDSKQLSEKQREELYKLIDDRAASWSVGIVSEKAIDEINILNATKLAMKQAAEKLRMAADFLLIDGNNLLDDFPASQLALPKADQFILSISAASIMAKVTRDRILTELSAQYSEYGFEKHKGYGTKFHLDVLNKKGPCDIHRKSFEPIKSMLGGDILGKK